MNYKETLFFIGKSLTVAICKTNRKLVEDALQNVDINWENIVKVSTAHYVLPTLYCNYKKIDFLKYLPKDLVEYMEYLTNLNRERNQQIITQAKEINELLTAQNITPIFLKGTGNLLEGLYEDIGERMVGDIDFIVDEENCMKSINLLKNNGYYTNEESHNLRTFHWHYAKLIKKNTIASVEVHHKILSTSNNKHFNFFHGETKFYIARSYAFLKNNYKFLNTTLPKILNDNLYVSKKISLRIMYDAFLISNLEKITVPEIYSKSLRKKVLDYVACMEIVLGKKFIEETNTKHSKKYIKKYLNLLNEQKLAVLQNKFAIKTKLQKNRLHIFLNAFYRKEYANYVLKRVFKKELYQNILNSK